MNWEELQVAILTRHPDPGELVYIGRCGQDYTWSVLDDGARPVHAAPGGAEPEAWLYYSGRWPEAGSDEVGRFFDDLLAELESMTGGADRCRWSADDPWPHGH